MTSPGICARPISEIHRSSSLWSLATPSFDRNRAKNRGATSGFTTSGKRRSARAAVAGSAGP